RTHHHGWRHHRVPDPGQLHVLHRPHGRARRQPVVRGQQPHREVHYWRRFHVLRASGRQFVRRPDRRRRWCTLVQHFGAEQYRTHHDGGRHHRVHHPDLSR